MFNLKKYYIIISLILSLSLLGSCSNWTQDTQNTKINTGVTEVSPTDTSSTWTQNTQSNTGVTEVSPTDTSSNLVTNININIKDFLFNPESVTIKVWTIVTWTNEDSAPHTATSGGNFDSWKLNKWDSFSFTFRDVGNFDYICTYHPNMKGKIIVEN